MTTARLYTLVQIARQRKGGVAYVHTINTDGTIKKRQRSLIVRFPNHVGVLPVGSMWKVSGQQTVNQFMRNGYMIYEDVLNATHVSMVRLARHTLARWISLNVDGIGEVIANRLVRNRSLEKWVRSSDVDAICRVPGMSVKVADRLIEQWPEEGLYQTMEWLDELDLSPSLGFKLVKLFGVDVVEHLTANPFLLLGLDVPFDKVSSVIDSLKLTLPEDVILAGAAMHVVITSCGVSGSTVVSEKLLRGAVEKIIATPSVVDPGEAAVKHGLLVRSQDGYQVWGTALMEAAVARKLVASMNRPAGQGALLASWERGICDEALRSAVQNYEQTLPFTLSEEQRKAVIGALSTPVVGISGGAGTGKTTILQAIIGVYESLADGLVCLPIALSGRAAQRMAESSGKATQTIAKLIVDHLGEGKPSLPEHVLIVIDESSMVDLLSMYRLVGILPEATRFIFLGDIAQLPPVGGGLVFHVLYDSPIPFFELSQVKRQSDQSPVHRFATAVRNTQVLMPEPAAETLVQSAECCISSPPSLRRLTEFWREADADRIILSPRRSGEWGVAGLNEHFQKIQGPDRPDLHYLDPSKGWIPWVNRDNQRLKEGDPILVTKNIYDIDLNVRNGDLGVVTKVFDHASDEGWSGLAEINSEIKGINHSLLEVLDLGYAITIHKAQGSQWTTVFSVVTQEAQNMLDASLIYTAATRPTKRLVLIADAICVQDAIKAGNTASRKHVDLGNKIAKLMAGCETACRSAEEEARG